MTKFTLPLCLVALTAMSAFGQQKLSLVTGKAFDTAVPKDFYLEGNAIPTQKRNASMVQSTGGARAIFSLIDTAGYSADITAKYIGMVITEGQVTICGQKVAVGSYGFGWTRSEAEPAKFSLYNQAGGKVAECGAQKDAQLKQPRPLQVIVNADGSGRLYYGRTYIDLK